MPKASLASTLVIHACLQDQLQGLSALLTEYGLAANWESQPMVPASSRCELEFKMPSVQIEELVSRLNKIDQVYLDLQTSEALYMIAPGLGIYRAQTNEAGEIVISEERIRLAMEQSAGNYRELARLLRLLLGQNWDDVLESFRAARFNNNVSIMNRAV